MTHGRDRRRAQDRCEAHDARHRITDQRDRQQEARQQIAGRRAGAGPAQGRERQQAGERGADVRGSVQKSHSRTRPEQAEQDEGHGGARPPTGAGAPGASDQDAADDDAQVDQERHVVDQAGDDSADSDGRRVEGHVRQPVGVNGKQPATQGQVPLAHVLAEENHRGAVRLSRPQPGGVPDSKQPGQRAEHADEPEPAHDSLTQYCFHGAVVRPEPA